MRLSPPSSKALIIVSAATLLATVLPILAWGDIAGFFAHPARAGFVAASSLGAIAGAFAGVRLSGGVPEDRGNRWVLWLLGLISITMSLLPAYMDRRDIWTL